MWLWGHVLQLLFVGMPSSCNSAARIPYSLFQELGGEMRKLVVIGAALAALYGAPALAADMLVKAPAAPVAQPGSFYAWADGSWQDINLPEYGLGRRNLDPASGDLGVAQTFKPRVDGAGGAAAIGYVVPYGIFGSAFGSNLRFELGGSYAKATGSSSGFTTFPLNSTVQLVNGLVTPAVGCGPPGCAEASTLSTDYTTWQINLKGASDFKFGVATLTPSLSVFGGDTHDDQTLNQSFGFVPALFPDYTAISSLRWSDWGAKFGLDTKIPVAPWLTLGLGGYAGVADRNATLGASDSCPACTFVATGSAISSSATAVPFLGNAEASVIVTPWNAVSVKAFGGLNYDSKVPGISSPSFGGAAPAVLPDTVGTPAGIKFASETSYYAGGLLKVTW
jgi:hypothetical protein